MKTLTFELPEDLWVAFEQIAAREGKSAESIGLAWLAKHSRRGPGLPEKETEEARKRFRRHFGSVNSGDPRSGDNERIDADLAEVYDAKHERQT